MVQASGDALGFDAGVLQGVEDLGCDLAASDVRIFLLVVMGREAVETHPSPQHRKHDHLTVDLLVDQVRALRGVDLDRVPSALPMRRQHHDGSRLDVYGDLVADVLELAECRVVVLVHDVGLVTWLESL